MILIMDFEAFAAQNAAAEFGWRLESTVPILDVLTVQHIDATPSLVAGVMRYLITLSDGRQLTTIHGWLAREAERLMRQQIGIEVESIHTKYGLVLQRLSPARSI